MRANSIRDGAHLVFRLSSMFVLVALLAIPAAQAQVPTGKPDDVALSAKRLERIGEMIERAVDEDQISGAVTIVARRGHVAHFEAHGLMDITSVPQSQAQASASCGRARSGGEWVVKRSSRGRRSKMLSCSTCSIWLRLQRSRRTNLR